MVTVDGSQIHDDEDPLQIGTHEQLGHLPVIEIQGMSELLTLLMRIEMHLAEASGLDLEEESA